MRLVTGDNDWECPAADQDEQECVEQSLGRSSVQGKGGASLLELPCLSTDQFKREGAEPAAKSWSCLPHSVLITSDDSPMPSSALPYRTWGVPGLGLTLYMSVSS